MSQTRAAAAGVMDVGGDLTVNRLGSGEMRITGEGVCRTGTGPGRRCGGSWR